MGRSQVCRQGNLGTLFVLTSISLVLTSVCVRTQFADLRQKMLVSCIFFRKSIVVSEICCTFASEKISFRFLVR